MLAFSGEQEKRQSLNLTIAFFLIFKPLKI